MFATSLCIIPSYGSRPRTAQVIIRTGRSIQFEQQGKSFFAALTAHVRTGSEPGTHGRPIRMAIQTATVVLGQLHAPHPCWLAMGHAGDGRGNREDDTTSSTTGSTLHIWNPIHPQYLVQIRPRTGHNTAAGARQVSQVRQPAPAETIAPLWSRTIQESAYHSPAYITPWGSSSLVVMDQRNSTSCRRCKRSWATHEASRSPAVISPHGA